MRNFYEQFRFLKLSCFVMLLFVFGQIQAQDRTVNGKVTSGEDGSAIPGVSIIVTGTTTGTITDLDGNYKLTVPSGASLTFSAVGYQSQSIDVGNQSVIDVIMQTDITQLSEVVVIGYGTREKKDLTGAISVMESDEIEQSVSMAPELAMQGRMAGVLVTTPSSLPSDRPTVRIRGVSTFGIADPLYVIDGIPITEFGAGYEQEAAVVRDIRGPVNVLSTINPDDIESISVLKDASAAAIYGVRASNGVILITTKQGKRSTRPKVDFNYTFGIANIPKKFDMSDVPTYTRIYQESFAANDAFVLPGYFDPDSANAVTPYEKYLGDKPTIDWQDPYIRNNAANTDVSARIYGGSENTNYYISTGYSFIEAPIKRNDQERYSFAANINSSVAKWIDVGVTYRLSYVDVTNVENSLSEVTQTPPWQPIYIEDDYYPINSPIEDKFGYATVSDTTTTPNPDHPMFGGSNPDAPPYNVGYQFKYGNRTWMNRAALQDPRINDSKYSILRNIGNAFVKLKLYKGLFVKGGISLDYYHNNRENWSYIGRDMYNITPGNPYATGDGLTTVGSLGYRNSYNKNIVKDITIDYLGSFGDHNINITLNAMDQEYSYRMISSSSQYITQEDPEKRGFIESEDYTTVGEWNDRNALQGYMARASYNYASKYYVDATIRRDGTSRFAPDYRWGTFPSFALAWRMSAENFMGGLNWLNDLKWRFGWGQLGNQETAAFAWLSSVNRSPQYQFGSGNGDGYGNTQNGLFLPDFPTEDLSWETSTTINFGFDGIFLNNRLTATIEYYNRTTDDILQQVSFPASVGNYNNPIINVASVENKGFEFQLGWRDQIGKVEYFVNANLTTVHNEVTEVWNNQPFMVDSERIPGVNTDGRIEKGYPLYYIWGYKVGGIFQSQEDIDKWYADHPGGDAEADPALVAPGDFYFQDLRGAPNKDEGYDFYTPFPDSAVNLNDRVQIGNTIPKHFYGINFGANYKGFDISVFLQGIGGVDKLNSAMQRGLAVGNPGSNLWTNVWDSRWTSSSPYNWNPDDKANMVGRLVRDDPGGNGRYSDRWVQQAGFMRLRNATLGYSVPQTLLGKWEYIERLRVYISGNNLLTFTKWQGIDPENDDYPIPVTWTFGVNATF